MRRIGLIMGALIVVLIVALPASAGSRQYAQDKLDYWTEYVEGEGYEVFYTRVERVEEDHSMLFTFDLDPGHYMFIAEGGEDIENIDMYVYDEDGYELVSDNLPDNYPICELELSQRTEVEVEVAAYSIAGGEGEDYFSFLAASRAGGADGDRAGEVEDILDYWLDWVEDSGFTVLYSDTGVLRRDAPESYEFELSRGTYHVYAESLYEEDDIDLFVRDEEAEEIASDTLEDNYPICSFDLRSDEPVSIEVAAYAYSSGDSTEYAIVIATEDDGRIIDGETPEPGERERPVGDADDREYIEGVRGEYMEMVIDRGYDMIFDQVEMLESGKPGTVRITLGRGDYIVFAEGGLAIADLDLRVYDEDGYVVSEDTLTDSAPVCEFSTRESSTFEIEIEPYEMEPGYRQGYYLLIVVRE